MNVSIKEQTSPLDKPSVTILDTASGTRHVFTNIKYTENTLSSEGIQDVNIDFSLSPGGNRLSLLVFDSDNKAAVYDYRCEKRE